jgi:hypothetical protein
MYMNLILLTKSVNNPNNLSSLILKVRPRSLTARMVVVVVGGG